MSDSTRLAEDAPGVAVLDQLRLDLLAALNKLSCTADNEFTNGYGALVAQVERAFQTEEQWMEEIAFHSLRMHREQHARVLGALHHVHARVMDGELGVGRHVVDELLRQWLDLHALTMHASLARAMQIARAADSHRAGGWREPPHVPH